MIESVCYLLLGMGAAFCAYRAMISKHLLPSTLYLACVSALASITLYMLGAQEVAVIELSVGAGLVTVLLVYAISVVGEDNLDPSSIIPKPLAFVLVATITILAASMVYPLLTSVNEVEQVPLAQVLWKERALDVWVQVALIFSGVMGVLGLRSEKEQKNKSHEEVIPSVELEKEVPV